jgi:hypothetical protein
MLRDSWFTYDLFSLLFLGHLACHMAFLFAVALGLTHIQGGFGWLSSLREDLSSPEGDRAGATPCSKWGPALPSMTPGLFLGGP